MVAFRATNVCIPQVTNWALDASMGEVGTSVLFIIYNYSYVVKVDTPQWDRFIQQNADDIACMHDPQQCDARLLFIFFYTINIISRHQKVTYK